jgi:uncharacterized membrane protein
VKPGPAIIRILWAITLLLVLIGVAIVIRRTLNLFASSPAPRNFPEAAALDAGFAPHRLLTMVHIIPGLFFVVLGPLQFIQTLRNHRPALHRWTGRVVIVSGMIIGVSALVMSPQMAIGGVNEAAATMLFAIVFLFALIKAFLLIRRGKVALHREWMIRAFAIGLAVASIRPIMGVFFATRDITHLTPHDFFGTAFWLGFTVQLMVAEVWINWTRRGTASAADSRPMARRTGASAPLSDSEAGVSSGDFG